VCYGWDGSFGRRLRVRGQGEHPPTVISLLSGIGAGLLGFWAVWRYLVGSVWDHVPGPGHDGWFLAGIFVPGVVVPLAVFRVLSQPTGPQPAASEP
jgi:hypothetical protein